jgi:DNA-directed RNA polymerase subunit L
MSHLEKIEMYENILKTLRKIYAMKFTNFASKASNELVFDVWDVDLSVINAIRRIILAEIPNVAFPFDPLTDKNPEITVIKNTGAFHNEFLFQRISLIPICFDEHEVEHFNARDYVFKLEKHNTSCEPIKITTRDFEIFDISGKKYDDQLCARLFPKDPLTGENILITVLRPNLHDAQKGEALNIELRARVGIAKEHSRWCPVSKCSFFNKIDQDKCSEAFDTELARLHSQPDTTEEILSRFEQKFHTLDKYRYFHVNRYNEPCAFTFQLESECKLSPTYLFEKALDILTKKIDAFSANVGRYKMTVNGEMVTIDITDEDYTLLNTLQCCIYNNCFRKDNNNGGIHLTYIGYYQSHPLDQTMVLKMKFRNETVAQHEVVEFMRQQCADIVGYIEEVAATWRDQSKDIKAQWE